ncbi:MAG: hypothetical protein QN229_06985 [Desulfurococcaceae archaeon TW002]
MNYRKTIAVVRLDLSSSSRMYAESINEVLEHISSNVTLLLCLSQVSSLYDFINGYRKYNNYRNHVRNIIKKLLNVARRSRVSIVITPLVRKGGDKAYFSTGVIPPLGQPFFKAGNILPVNDKISSNKTPEVFDVGGIKLCFIYLKELEVPEVARVCKFLGSDIIVSVNPPLLTERDPELTLKLGVVRAVENNIPLVGLGGYLSDKKLQQPTFLINSSGDVVDFYNDYEPAVFEVEIERLDRSVRLDLMRKYLKLIKEISTYSTYRDIP